MADLNLIRTRLLLIVRPELASGEEADLIGLFEEWATWTEDAEVDMVADMLEEGQEPRFLRLLIQYTALIGTTRALARLQRMALTATPAVRIEAMRSLEKSATPVAQRLLIDWALQNDSNRDDVLQALTRCATLAVVEDLKLALLRPLPPETELTLLSIFKKLHAREAVDTLFDVLEQPQKSQKIQAQAIFSIAHLGQPKHLRKVLPFLNSEDPGLRRAAFFALHRLDLKKGPEKILARLAQETQHAVRLEALRDLQSIRKTSATAVRLARQWSLRADHPFERRLAEGLLERWHIVEISPKALGHQALHDTDPVNRAAALEALGTSLPKLTEAFQKLSSLKRLCLDASSLVRYTAAFLTARFTPAELLADFIPEELEAPALRAFLYTLERSGRTDELPPAMVDKLVYLAQAGDRSLRALALRLLTALQTPAAARHCQALALCEKEPRLAREAAWGVLLYAAFHPFAFEELLRPLLEKRRSLLNLISLVPRLENQHAKARKALALRLGIFLSTLPDLQDPRLDRSRLGWLLLWRALGKELEGDFHEWFSLGSLPKEGSSWLLRVMVSLLRGKTLRMDFRWLGGLMDSPQRMTREQAAALASHHFPWTADQTRKLVRWRITEFDKKIQETLDYLLREKSLGFQDDRRRVPR